MAGPIGDDVQLIMESSWTVCRGSLESCITVVFVDPFTQEPDVPSHCNAGRLSLVPGEESVPCEITIRFQGRQCDVQSLYILSTARTYELYSQSDLMTDRDYVCTVKGWSPDKGTEAGCSEETSKVAYANGGANGVSDELENENNLNETEHGSAALDSGAYPSCTVKEQVLEIASRILNEQTDILDSVGLEKEDPNRSIYSSGEDSWVDVKLSGSFSGDSLPEASVPAHHFDEKLDGAHQGRDCLDRHSLEDNSRPSLVADDGMQTVYAELNHYNLPMKDCFVPFLHEEEKVESGDLSESLPVADNMYEAELELNDQCPWTSLTIRFLSLKDKSCVEVDQMVLLVVPGAPILKATSSNESLSKHNNSALLATLIPSMLRMVQGAANQIPKDVSHGLRQNNNTNSMMIRPTVDSATPKEQERSFVTPPVSVEANLIASTEVIMMGGQGLTTSVENTAFENVRKHNTACSNFGTERILNSAETFEKPLQPNVNVLSEREAATMSIDKPVEASLQPTSKAQLACNAGYACPHLCKHEKSNSGNVSLNLDPLLERFDRLEALCMRMEAYIGKAVENLDQRLTHLERQQTSMPVSMPLEPQHITSTELPAFSRTSGLSMFAPSSGSCCLEAKEGDAVKSSPQTGTNITQQTAVDAQTLESSDINTSSGQSVCALFDDVSKAFDAEALASTNFVGSRSSTMPEVHGHTEEKPQISLDDAWNSALSAFSSSCSPAHKDSKVEQDIICTMEDKQSCVPPSDVTISVPCADLECTLSKETQELSKETPVNSFFETTNPIDPVDVMFDQVCSREVEQTVAFSKDWNIQQNQCYNDTVDVMLDQVCSREVEQTVAFSKDWNSDKTDTSVVDLEGHAASPDPLGGVPPDTENDKCMSVDSREDMGKGSNSDAIIDLMSCFLCSIQSEQDKILSGSDILVSETEKSHLKYLRKVTLDSVDPELLCGLSFFSNRRIEIEQEENGVPSSDIILDNILGEDNVIDAYDTACSESSTCISQEFDTIHDHISVSNRSSSQNLCFLGDLVMTDTDIEKHGLDFLEESLFMNHNFSHSSSSFSKGGSILQSFFDFSLSEPHLLDVDQTPHQQSTGHTIFPGFEDIL